MPRGEWEKSDRSRQGGGRQARASVRARQAGDRELADKLAAPSEKRLTPEQQCGAKKANAEGTCSRRRGAGTDHPGYGYCSSHGGNTEAGVKSAMREAGHDLIQQYKAERPFGGDRTDPSLANLTPEQALLEEVRRSAAMVRFLEERIQMWNLNEVQASSLAALEKFDRWESAKDSRKRIAEFLETLPNEDPDSPAYLPPLTERHPQTGIVSFTDAREWLYLYREERGHLARVSKMCIDAGVANRLVSIAEDQGRILASAIRAVLTALSLSPEQAALVPRVVPPILRAVASDSPLPDPTRLALAASEGLT